MKDFSKEIRAYALRNAIAHEGKAVASSVLTPLFVFGLNKEQIKDVMPKINVILREVNSLSLEEQKKEFEKLKDVISERKTRNEDELPELDNVDGRKGVIMRFSPSASGIMHLGHIITGMPTSLYVKKYGGKFYLRIEDTNPEKSDPEAYTSFPKDSEWIFGNVTEWYAQSDRMQKYYDFAKDLIKKGAAFVCTCKSSRAEKDEESEDKSPREICDCRENSIKDNQEKWERMINVEGFAEGEAILRFKSPDTKLKNPALIDFPLARINETEHPRQGKKYRVWPLMNLCVALDDIEFKSTHIIRGKEHADNALRQEMIFKIYKKPMPKTYFLGRYKFEDLPLSKSRFQEMIKSGEYSGWDDIRLPLARNFKRRGYQPEAFAKMAIKRGLSSVDKVISQKDYFAELDNLNREIIKKHALKASFEELNEKSEDTLEILMPDSTIIHGKSDINLKKLKNGQIIYFSGLGYCRFNSEEEISFWFAHR